MSKKSLICRYRFLAHISMLLISKCSLFIAQYPISNCRPTSDLFYNDITLMISLVCRYRFLAHYPMLLKSFKSLVCQFVVNVRVRLTSLRPVSLKSVFSLRSPDLFRPSPPFYTPLELSVLRQSLSVICFVRQRRLSRHTGIFPLLAS